MVLILWNRGFKNRSRCKIIFVNQNGSYLLSKSANALSKLSNSNLKPAALIFRLDTLGPVKTKSDISPNNSFKTMEGIGGKIMGLPIAFARLYVKSRFVTGCGETAL